MSRNKKRNKRNSSYSNSKKNNRRDAQHNIMEMDDDFHFHNDIIKPKEIYIEPRTRNQSIFLDTLNDDTKHIVIGYGPAGTGKTYLATKFAIQELLNGNIERVVITRPAISVSEQHGFLPGGIKEKMEPWILPILDVFYEHFTKYKVDNMIDESIIDIAPLAYMRGRTFKKCIILADEMQNALPDQVKMILTRIGNDSKIIMTGDLDQHDRGFEKNGLKDFIEKVEITKSKMIEVVKFNNSDIRRHPVIKDVLNIYNDGGLTDEEAKKSFMSSFMRK